MSGGYNCIKSCPLTVLVHLSPVTLVKPTRAALVAMRLVNWTLAVQFALRLARVDAIAMDAALEESRAA